MTLQELLHGCGIRLAAAGIDNPALDVRLLVLHALGLDRAAALGHAERVLSAEEISKTEILIERRLKREPVARILGEREFWSLPFGLNEATLEPRPDSETLVEAVLKHLSSSVSNPHILDLGTGTGCLLLSLLYELPQAKGIGIDSASRAVEQAQLNAERIGLTNRVTFRVGNWFDRIIDRFDVIVSNPPYIMREEIKTLQPEVRDYDPVRALDGGEDGLDIYRHLTAQAGNYLKSKAIIAFEVGQGQAIPVSGMCEANKLRVVEVRRDLGGVSRCVVAVKK